MSAPTKKEKLTLTVSSTISESSYEEAREVIKQWVFDNNGNYERYITYTLVVDYFNVDTALHLMAKYRDCDITLCMKWGHRWELRANHHNVYVCGYTS